MKRRKFLIFSSVLGLSSTLMAKNNPVVFSRSLKNVEKTIYAVQEHLFPVGSKIPSAKSMKITHFLLETITHALFDKDIRAFVIEGAEELEVREKGKFTTLSTTQKEKALRAYEKTHYGSNWLSRIMALSMEGMFSDPIYGSNIKEGGWESIHTYGGLPRPTTRYIKL